jgi:hypothetical protein
MLRSAVQPAAMRRMCRKDVKMLFVRAKVDGEGEGMRERRVFAVRRTTHGMSVYCTFCLRRFADVQRYL